MDYQNKYSFEEWIESGRKDTLNMFLNEEYGFLPDECQKPLRYEVVEEKEIDNI